MKRMLQLWIIGIFGMLWHYGHAPAAELPKDTLIIGMQTASTISLDPARAYEYTSAILVNQLYDKLVDFAPDDVTRPVPELAESWEVSEDGNTWTFHLRKDALFHSGNPVNADAVVFSLRRAIALQGGPSWLLTQFGMTPESVQKVDDATVQIVLDQPYAPGIFLAALAYTIGGIVDPAMVKQFEQDGDSGSAWLNEHSAGSGAYRLERAIQNEHFALQANERYWKMSVPMKHIIFQNVPEAMNQLMMLQNGDIDLAWNLLPGQLQQLREESPTVQISATPVFSLRYLAMNVGYEPLSKPLVRDAIRYAIDYDTIVTHILEGAAVKAQTFLPFEAMFASNPATPYAYDLEKAKRLLIEAGYPDGFDVELLCATDQIPSDIAQKMQSDFGKIGIRVTVTSMPAAQVSKSFRGRSFQMALATWASDYADPDANAKPFAHANSLGDDAAVKQIAWRCQYVNQETSRMVEKAVRESDAVQRAALYRQITEKILHDGPVAILYYPLQLYALRPEIKGFVPSPLFFLHDFSSVWKE
ncbi:ABC-type dipeptide transport system, periplasmic component [Candidatus Moduliflexus flocculans]|uniref:ABC-type dipeptide transport system, periplasmic component n=1 Tax=Candidatus Moduliflexus flocculans TaxID=1499966 RepID=A0A0S6VXL0_9BACT|nr:ABC-type dipeptide transport system, periplasmic component [Candidatus Moduliflexus flocculans]